MPYTLLNHTAEVAFDGVSYFGTGAAPPLCGLQLDFYASPCSKVMSLIGSRGRIPSPSKYDFIVGLEWINDNSSEGGFCRANLVQGGLPGSGGANGWIFGVFGGYPLNGLFSLSGKPIPKFAFSVNVTVLDELYDYDVQSIPLKYTGPWNVIHEYSSGTTERLSHSPSFIASLPTDAPHTVGYLKYSANFGTGQEDDIGAVAICVSWKRPSGLMDKCDLLQKGGSVLNGSHVLSGSNSVGAWFVTVYALKQPNGEQDSYDFPYNPVDGQWITLEEAQNQQHSQIFRRSEIDNDISTSHGEAAPLIGIWVENLTVCPDRFRTDPLDGFQDQNNCSLEISHMSIITPDIHTTEYPVITPDIQTIGYPVSVENFIVVKTQDTIDDTVDSNTSHVNDCGDGYKVQRRNGNSVSASWSVPIVEEVIGSSGTFNLLLEPLSPKSKIGDCEIVSADILSSPAILSIQSGGVNGDDDAVITFHTDIADDIISNTETGMVNYTWKYQNFPLPYGFGSTERMSLSLNITLNPHGQQQQRYNLSTEDDNNNDNTLLLGLIATPTLELNWCSDEVCPIERGHCIPEPWPIIGWHQSDAIISKCDCSLGFGGEACKDRVVSKFVVFVWMISLTLSMAAGIPSARLAMRLGPKMRTVGVMLMCSMITSALYHMCDLNTFCLVEFKLLRILDNSFVLGCFCSIMFYLSYVPSDELEHMLMTVVLILICVLTIACLGVGDYAVLGYSILISGIFMVCSWYVEIHNLSTVKENLGCCGAMRKFFISGNYVNASDLSIGFILLFGGVLCFALSTILSYALMHSLWHVCEMGSAYYFIRSRHWRCPLEVSNLRDDDREGFIELKETYRDEEEEEGDDTEFSPIQDEKANVQGGTDFSPPSTERR